MTTLPRPSVPPLEASPLPATRVETLPGDLRATLVPAGVIPSAAVRLVIHNTGSAHNPASMPWLDRFVDDYLREGTEQRDAESFASALAALGGRLDIDGDEHTTTIGTEVPSEHAPAAVTLLAELARTPRFPEDSATRLIEDALRSLDIAQSQPFWLAFSRFRRALYGSHPYGRALPTAEQISSMTVADARAFWERAGAAGTRLLVAGLFDADAVLQAARAAFDGWGPGTPRPIATPEPRTHRAVHLVDRPGAEQSTLQLGLHVPAPGHEDYVPLEVLNSLLGGSFYSRITLNIREDKGYTYSPRSNISTRPGDAYWAEAADVTTAVTGASIREILGEIERLRSEPPTAEELQGIVNYVVGSFVIRQATPSGILDHLEFLDVHGLDRSYSEAYVARVRQVTPAAIQQLAQRYLDPAAMPIVVVGDAATVRAQVEEFGAIED